VADAPERSPRAGSDTTRATFGLSRVLAWDADDHGGLVHGGPRGREDDTQLVSALVFPGARGSLVVADSFARIVGAPIESDASRLAHALSFQRLRWASGDLPRPHPTVVAHRDVRDRMRMLLPFFAQGTSVTPIVLGDSLFWCVDLYAASSFYPLSQHLQIAGDDRTYFQHAATGIVYAATGETFVVADSGAGPIAQSWIKRFPTLFVSWAVLPSSLRAAVPPAVDAVRAQAVALGAFGTRVDSDVPRRPPLADGSDSALAGTQPIFVTRETSAPAIGVVLLDASDRVRGVVYGVGGAARRTLWYDAGANNPRWATVLDELRGTDSAVSGSARDAAIARGPVRAIPIAGGLAFVQPTYSWRAQGAPTLLRVSVLIDDTVHVAPTLAQLAGMPLVARTATSPGPAATDLRARAAVLYARMRDALRRGDWAAFGAAFDELGRLLGGAR
jgi:hypothetical protein